MLDFQDLYETYAMDVYRFAFWLSGDSAEAEDITSETFIQAWVNRDNIRTETLKAYLFTITRNAFLQRLRKNKNHILIGDDHPDTAPGPDEQVETQLQLQRAQKMLQTLPEIDRTALILRVQQELPYAEIARVLGMSLTAAKVKVHRARKKLIAACVDEEVR